MTTYHLSCKTYGRAKGHSAVSVAAYRAATCIKDERTKRIHDYSKKPGMMGCEIIVPEHAPAWARDQSALWNAVEAAEVRRNASVSREFEVSLRIELAESHRRALVRQLARELVQAYGFAAQVSFHNRPQGNQRNFHAYILCSTRTLTSRGLGEKTRVLDNRFTGPQEILRWRKRWEEIQTDYFSKFEGKNRVDSRYLRGQQLDREPTSHQGRYLTHVNGLLALELRYKTGFRGWNRRTEGLEGSGPERGHLSPLDLIDTLQCYRNTEDTLRTHVERLYRRLDGRGKLWALEHENVLPARMEDNQQQPRRKTNSSTSRKRSFRFAARRTQAKCTRT